MESKFVYFSIELMIECPNDECGNFFNLFDDPRFTDDGVLYDILMPRDDHWGCDDFQKQIEEIGLEIKCPDCETIIEVERVDW